VANATAAKPVDEERAGAQELEHDRRPLDLAIVRRLYGFTRPYARTRNWLFLMVVLRAMQFPALAWTTAAVLSGPIAARDARGTVYGVLGFIAVALSAAFVLHFRVRLSLELGEAVIQDVRATLLRHLMVQPVAFFQRRRVGSLISRLTSDLEAVRVGVKDVAFVGTVQLGSMVIAALIMLYYDYKLFLVLVGLVPILTAIVRRFRSPMLQAYRTTQESFSRVTATVAETIDGIRVVQSHGRGDDKSAAFRAQIDAHGQLNVEAAQRAAALLPLFDLNGQVFLALLLSIGGYRVLHGSMPLDTLVQFFFLSSHVFNPIAALGTQYDQALTAMAGAERVFSLLDTPPSWTDADDAVPIGPIEGRVVLEKLSFGYDPGRLVLRDIDLTVESGQTVALVGRTGSGKSTLLGMIAKFHQPTSGRVLIDDVDLSRVTSDSLRSQFGSVLQSNFLFSGSVLDNVRFARPGASDAEIRAAAEALDVLDLIEAFPHGWQTRVAERGVGLSLGQRQLVCFVRAMLANPRLLLLDEATSAVDVLAERRLQRALERLLVGRTSFIVAHRLSTVRNADLVLVMEQGRIVERGDHATLLERQGAYYRLYREYLASGPPRGAA
jgi:ATP-binding cassette subfamily B protein